MSSFLPYVSYVLPEAFRKERSFASQSVVFAIDLGRETMGLPDVTAERLVPFTAFVALNLVLGLVVLQCTLD